MNNSFYETCKLIDREPRERKILTESQREILEAVFSKKTRYPDIFMREEMATKIGLSDISVQVSFYF